MSRKLSLVISPPCCGKSTFIKNQMSGQVLDIWECSPVGDSSCLFIDFLSASRLCLVKKEESYPAARNIFLVVIPLFFIWSTKNSLNSRVKTILFSFTK